jgi:hypothetical protein
MNWDAIGAGGEVLGALAVLATLIYLASQIKQSNRFESAKHLDVHMDRIRQFHYEIATDPETSRIWHTGLVAGELSIEEQQRFDSLATVRILIQRDAWMRARTLSGTVDIEPEVYLQILAALIAINPGLHSVWQDRYNTSRTFNREFVELVNPMIEERLKEPLPQAPSSF